MCYIDGYRVSRQEYIRIMDARKELEEYKNLVRPAQTGFEYGDWPIIKPVTGKKDFEITMSHWEYIPSFINDEFELREARKMNTWLNAKGETLLVNEKGRPSMYKEGALQGRCLVLSTGFYEWRHIPKIGQKGQELKATEKIPYRIGVAGEDEIFFMAGVSREWTNRSRGQSASTFAIVTTEANDLMAQVHNAKKRMPVILPESLAYEWLFEELDEKRLKELATYQFDSENMFAYPVSKKFLSELNPELEVLYEELPPII